MNLRFEQPFEQGPTTARDPISDDWVLKTGLAGSPILFVDDIQVTEEVASGGIVDVEVTVVNTSTSIRNTDPDSCRAGLELGWEYEVTVSPSWTGSESETKCLKAPSLGFSNRETHRFDFDALNAGGTGSVNVEVRTTGERSGGVGSYSVNFVDDGSDDRPGSGDDDDDEEDDDDPLIVDIPNLVDFDSGSVNSSLVILVLLLLLLLVVGLALP